MILSPDYNPSLDYLCEQERELAHWREDLFAYTEPDWDLIDRLDRHRDWLAGQIDQLASRPVRGRS